MRPHLPHFRSLKPESNACGDLNQVSGSFGGKRGERLGHYLSATGAMKIVCC